MEHSKNIALLKSCTLIHCVLKKSVTYCVCYSPCPEGNLLAIIKVKFRPEVILENRVMLYIFYICFFWLP